METTRFVSMQKKFLHEQYLRTLMESDSGIHPDNWMDADLSDHFDDWLSNTAHHLSNRE